MFYSYPLTIAAANTVDNPATVDMDLSAGIIHQADFLFPDTADHNIRVQVFDASFQVWPSNRGGTIRGDAAVISFREFYELTQSSNRLQARAWWAGTSTECTIWIQLGVLPRAILQPFSLAELLRAVQQS